MRTITFLFTLFLLAININAQVIIIEPLCEWRRERTPTEQRIAKDLGLREWPPLTSEEQDARRRCHFMQRLANEHLLNTKKRINSKEYIMETIMKNIPVVTPEFEVFDREYFFFGTGESPNILSEGKRRTRIEGNETISVFATAVRYIETVVRHGLAMNSQQIRNISTFHHRGQIEDRETSLANPLWAIHRDFYLTGGIKSKGVFSHFGFRVGLWYRFDEDGNLIETVDHDKGFDFTMEDVFAFSIKNGVDLLRVDRAGLPTAWIWRQIDEENNRPIWIIIHTPFHGREVSIVLDGKTGELIEWTERNIFAEE